MGKIVITENVGRGLYRGRLLFNVGVLQAAIAALKLQQLDYWRKLNNALNVRKALRADVAAAREALDAVIQQWKDKLAEQQQTMPMPPEPPVLPPGFDATATLTDEERTAALAHATAGKINERRAAVGAAPLAESQTLNRALFLWGREQTGGAYDPAAGAADYAANTDRLSDLDSQGRLFANRLVETVPGIALRSGDAFHVSGPDSVDAAVDAFMRNPDAKAALLSADAKAIGVSYHHAPNTSATHVWKATAVDPMPAPPENADFFASGPGNDLKAAVADQLGADVAEGLDHGPDGGSGGGGTGSGSWAEPWQAVHEYGIGAQVQGTRIDGSMCLAQSQVYGVSGADEPLWPGGGGIGDGGILWIVLSDIPSTVGGAVVDYYKGIGLLPH